MPSAVRHTRTVPPLLMMTGGAVRYRHIGPSRWQREQLPVLVVQVDPVLAPVLPACNELEVAAMQLVERVGHPDPAVSIIWIGCS